MLFIVKAGTAERVCQGVTEFKRGVVTMRPTYVRMGRLLLFAEM